MSRSKNTIKLSDISSTPIKVKYSATYASQSLLSYGITTNRGQNIIPSASMFSLYKERMVKYRVIRQLYYQNSITGSNLNSASFWDQSWQSTAASGSFDSTEFDFPTGSGYVSSSIGFFAIPALQFGEQLSRNSVRIKSTDNTSYDIIDDGNGNILDTLNSSVYVGNVFYAQGIITFTNNDYVGIIGNCNFTIAGSAVGPISPTPSVSVSPSSTPSVSVSPTPSLSVGASPPAPSVTPSVTPSSSPPPPPVSPSVTPSSSPPPPSPSVTPSVTPSTSVPPSVTPSVTPSTSVPTYTMTINAKQNNAAAPNDLQIIVYKNGSSQGIFTVNNAGGVLTTLTGLSVGDVLAFAYDDPGGSVKVGYNRNVTSNSTPNYPGNGATCLGGVGGSGEYTIIAQDEWMWFTFDGNAVC
jgi:hypothetical protein